ncbi:50S ribosomal protein L18 [Candidatus Woesearchaeota archaeon]|nr:50S ribosomal protein L18 [Candidatus Woesearchaeota archaeon]
MAKNSTRGIALRRKREGRTDYTTRRKLLGSDLPRFVFRKSLSNIQVQLVSFDPKGDKTLLTVNSRHLAAFGWKGHRGNLPAAYLTGYLCGLRAKQLGVQKAILDLGLQRAVPKSSAFAAVKGAQEAGLMLPCSPKVMPTPEQLQGVTIEKYAHHLGQGTHLQFKRVSSTVAHLSQHVSDVKKTLEQQWQTRTNK